MVNLLAQVDFALLEQGYKVGLDWLGQFARIIIEGVGIIGLGIVVFSLVLKAITLPFDIYQRVKMRKQNLIMANMKDDLEKLQKQYAGDKDTYNAKMMELYKKNGYSMLGACLPTILSLVILIVAFQGFRTYSEYANLELFVGMSEAYNEVIMEKSADGTDFTFKRDENGAPVVSGDTYTLLYTENGEEKERTLLWVKDGTFEENGLTYTMSEISGADSKGNTVLRKYFSVSEADKYLSYIYNLDATSVVREYKIDTEKLKASADNAEVEAIVAAAAEKEETITYETAAGRYLVRLGSLAAKDWYHAHDPGFLWVRNVWYPDVSYEHPIPSYTTFSNQLNVTVTLKTGQRAKLNTVLTQPMYENLTSELSKEKSECNGYFILIALSIGLMVLSQFIMMRSQKETNQYQTVDGQGAATQKIMLVMMPLIYAIFAFMYSAAFTIYMTMSSLISLIVTLLSNFFIGRVFKKKEEENIRQQYGRTLAWKEADKNKNKNTRSTRRGK